MATARPFMCRPYEYFLESGFDFSVGVTQVSDFTMGTYANVLGLAHSFCAYIVENALGTFDYRLTDTADGAGGYDTRLEFKSAGSTKSVDWENGGLGQVFGFQSDPVSFTADTWIQGDHMPWGIWAPTFQAADQDIWRVDLGDYAAGTVSQNGTWAGTVRGSDVNTHSIRFPFEFSKKLWPSKAVYANGKIETAWTLEYFLKHAMTDHPTSDTAASVQGFWFYPDINDAISDCSLAANNPWSEVSDIGINWDTSLSTDTKTFCHISPQEATRFTSAGPAFPNSELRYHVDLTLHTAPAETWVYVDYTP